MSRAVATPASGLVGLFSLPGYLNLSAAVLMLGLSSSLAGPYMSLYASNALGVAPVMLGVYMTSIAVSGIVGSTLLAARSDRTRDRRAWLLASLVMAGTGYALLAFVRSFLPALLVAVVFLGAGAGSFPQLFALAKARYGATETGERAVTALRSVFSLAWVMGPGLGAVVLGSGNFLALFATAGAIYAGAMLAVWRLGSSPSRVVETSAVATGSFGGGGPRRPMVWVMAAFTLFGMANSMASLALPLFVTKVLHQPNGLVGLLVGLCALLEIPVMLALALLPRRHPNETLVVAAFGLFAVYGLVFGLASGPLPLVLAQGIRAVVIAMAATQGMAYFQELMPSAVGRATALFGNSANAGGMLAGVAAGSMAQAFGFQSVYWLCTGASLLAFVLLFGTAAWARRRDALDA